MSFQRRRRRTPGRRLGPLLGLAVLGALLAAVLVLLHEDGARSVGPETVDPSVVPVGPGPAPPDPLPADPRPDPAEVPPDPAPVEPEIVRTGPEAVIGRVVDGRSGEPVSRFSVTVLPAGEAPPVERLGEAPARAFHQPSGIFRVETGAGRWDVVVESPGYQPGVLRDLGIPGVDARPVDIPLHRGAGITGLVYDENDMPVKNIPVFLRVTRLPAGAEPPRQTLAHTNVDGRFTFSPLPSGTYEVALLSPTNRTDRLQEIRVFDEMTHVEVYLQPRHQVVFRVEDVRGRPVAAARIELRGPNHYASEASNPNGVAVMEHVPDGRYVVSVRHAGFHEYSDDIELSGGISHRLEHLVLEPAGEG